MKMRESRVLKKLREGGVALCFKTNLADIRSVQIASLSGFDCVWTCMEHVPNSFETVERQVLAAKAYDVDVIVRVSRGGYSDYIRPLEMDASGIMVPHVMSMEDAQNIAKMTRFQPVGRRAVDGGNADAAFTLVKYGDYIGQANDQRMVIIQIEDFEPMEALNDIASVQGIDMLFFGPADYCHSIGQEYDFNNREVRKAREKVAEAAIRNKKFAGTVGSPDSIRELVDMGYKFVNLSSDVTAIAKYCRQMVGEAQKAMA